eukprot:GCRY01004305.1.p1 GENE.GCRY01004305.1~~GCRY01004305.1.p1  ORF type:complete len:308 (-),score=12.02 GCRY01004305.1:185-1108(-)
MSFSSQFSLYQWGPKWGLPTMEPECLAVLAYTKFTCPAINCVECKNPKASPSGTLPFLSDGDTIVWGALDVIEQFKVLGHNADVDLTPAQKGETRAFLTLLEEHWHQAVLHSWWCDPENYSEIIRPTYAQSLPFPLNYITPRLTQWNVSSLLHKRGWRDAATILSHAKTALTALSFKLGKNDYFFGDSPTSLDAFTYGHLASILFPPLKNNPLKRLLLQDFPNLVSFVDRINHTFFFDEALDVMTDSLHPGNVGPIDNGTPFTPEKSAISVEEQERQRTNRLFVGASTLMMVGIRVRVRVRCFRDLH